MSLSNNFSDTLFQSELRTLANHIQKKLDCEHCKETSSSIHREQCYLPAYCSKLRTYCNESYTVEALLWGLQHGILKRTEKRMFALRFNTEYPNVTMYTLNREVEKEV